MGKTVRFCASEGCKTRLAAVDFDGHTRCFECIGNLCSQDFRCDECKSWSLEVMDRYLKHRKKLCQEKVRRHKYRLSQQTAASLGLAKGDVGSNVSVHTSTSSPALSILATTSNFTTPSRKSEISKLSPSVVSSSKSKSILSSASAYASNMSNPSSQCSSRRIQDMAVNNRLDRLEALIAPISEYFANRPKDAHSDRLTVGPPGLDVSSELLASQLLDSRVNSSLCVDSAGGGELAEETGAKSPCLPKADSDPMLGVDRESKDKASKIKSSSKKRKRSGNEESVSSVSGKSVSDCGRQGKREEQDALPPSSPSVSVRESERDGRKEYESPKTSSSHSRSHHKKHKKHKSNKRDSRDKERSHSSGSSLSSSSKVSSRHSSKKTISDKAQEQNVFEDKDCVYSAGEDERAVSVSPVSSPVSSPSSKTLKACKRRRVEEVQKVMSPQQVAHKPERVLDSLEERQERQRLSSRSCSGSISSIETAIRRLEEEKAKTKDNVRLREERERVKPVSSRHSSSSSLSSSQGSPAKFVQVEKVCRPNPVSSERLRSGISKEFRSEADRVNVSPQNIFVLPNLGKVTETSGMRCATQVTCSAGGFKKSQVVSQVIEYASQSGVSSEKVVELSRTQVGEQEDQEVSRPVLPGSPVCSGALEKEVGSVLHTPPGDSVGHEVATTSSGGSVIHKVVTTSSGDSVIHKVGTTSSGEPTVSGSKELYEHSEEVNEELETGFEGSEEDPVAGVDIASLSSFRKLILRFQHKLPQVEREDEDDGRTFLEENEGVQKELPVRLCLSKHSKWRLRAVDKILNNKREARNPSSCLPLFLRHSTAKSYFTGEAPSASFDNALLAALDSILDEKRRHNLLSSKVSLSFAEMDNFVKSLHRLTEICSFLDWGIGAVWMAIKNLKERIQSLIPETEAQELAELLDFMKVLDTSQKHSFGETVYAYTNLVMKKREQVLNFASRDISKTQKIDLLFSPISGMKIFDKKQVEEIGVAAKSRSEHDSLVRVANQALMVKKNFFSPASSPLNAARGRGMNKAKNNFRGKAKRGRGKGRGGFYRQKMQQDKGTSDQQPRQ